MGAAGDDPSAVDRRSRAARVERPSLWLRHPRRRWRKKCSARPRPLAGPGADAPASKPPRVSVRANVLRRFEARTARLRDDLVLVDAVTADADGADEGAPLVERKPARKDRDAVAGRRAARAQSLLQRRAVRVVRVASEGARWVAFDRRRVVDL